MRRAGCELSRLALELVGCDAQRRSSLSQHESRFAEYLRDTFGVHYPTLLRCGRRRKQVVWLLNTPPPLMLSTPTDSQPRHKVEYDYQT